MCSVENTIIKGKVNSRIVHSLVYYLQGFCSQIYFSNRGRTVNAKSILGILSLGLMTGDEVQVSIVNDDIDTANEELKKIISYLRKIGEMNE